MADQDEVLETRSFSDVDAKRAAISLVIMAVVMAGYWFMLPALQSLIIPGGLSGPDGPWVIRPITAVRFCAAAAMGAVTFPLVMWPLQQAWNREDAALGSRYGGIGGPLKGLLLVKASLLLVVYFSALLFYLFSWTIIGPEGIEQRLPWTTRQHSYQDIVSLETIPEGQRSDSITQNGPWYSVRLKDGYSLSLCEDNEACTTEVLNAIATYIGERSGLKWERRSDARVRR